MRFCLTCRRFVPREAIFCPGCGGAVGGVRCVNGHTTSSLMQATYCPICRTRKLIEPARMFELGCLSRILAWGVALLGLKWAFANISGILAFLWNGVLFIIGCTVLTWLLSLLKLLVLIRILVWCVAIGSENLARKIDPFPKLVPAVFRASGKMLLWFLRALLYVVEGRVLPPKRIRKEGTGAQAAESHRS